MILVIAEKPALGEAIADAIPGHGTQKDGVITKGEYVITWAFGHLLTLKLPEDYDEKYNTWRLDDLPIYFEPWANKPGQSQEGKTSKSTRLKQIGNLLKEAEYVIHAGDIDEEGQLLIDEILRWCKYKGPVKRLDTSNTTTAALKKALSNLKDNASCEPDGWSAYGRELSDAIFGFNLTRYYTLKNGFLLPIGRVQTPTLGLVVRRDKLIENHTKLAYYELFADLLIQDKTVKAKFIPCKDDPALIDGRVLDMAFLKDKSEMLKNHSLSSVWITKTEENEAPPLPFNLTKLNTYCSKKWGYNPGAVLRITQSLRDNYKAITYNRSDCQYLSEDHYREAPDTIQATCLSLGVSADQFNSAIKSKCFNDAYITAHFAIIPSGEKVDISKMTEQERNVYTAISLYYLTQFMPNATREKTILNCDLGNGEALHATGSKIISPGYLSLLGKENHSQDDYSSESQEESVNSVLDIPAGIYPGQLMKTELQAKETKPPSRYTQASLTEDMTRVAKYVDDPKIRSLLMAKDKGKKGENGSIGTSATRASIVKGLISHGLLEETGKGKSAKLISTAKGRALYEVLPDDLKNVDTTALWWVMQEDIKLGKQTPEEMAKSVLDEVSAVIQSGTGRIPNAEIFGINGTKTEIGLCPLCNGRIVELAKSYACTTKGCKAVYFKDNRLLASIGKKMTGKVVQALITDGSCKLQRCKSKSGNTFDCTLTVSYEEDKKYPSFHLDMANARADQSIGNCPICGKPVVKNKYGNYICSAFKDTCNFRIFGTVSGKKLTDSNIKDLLTKGQTRTISGFTSKQGKSFDAALRLEQGGSTKFIFPNRKK